MSSIPELSPPVDIRRDMYLVCIEREEEER